MKWWPTSCAGLLLTEEEFDAAKECKEGEEGSFCLTPSGRHGVRRVPKWPSDYNGTYGRHQAGIPFRTGHLEHFVWGEVDVARSLAVASPGLLPTYTIASEHQLHPYDLSEGRYRLNTEGKTPTFTRLVEAGFEEVSRFKNLYHAGQSHKCVALRHPGKET